MLSTLVKLTADDIVKYFSYFPRKQIFKFHANFLPIRDNLQEMSNTGAEFSKSVETLNPCPAE